MLGSGMPILNAIGSSLFSVGSFGLTTAVNYALSGLIEWAIALLFIAGCVAGGYLGMHSAIRNHDVDVGGCRRRVRRASPSLSHEVLNGGWIGIAADDVEPGTSKRARRCRATSAPSPDCQQPKIYQALPNVPI
jgi:hypothetical protein